jgi:hypothetical protein
MKTSSKDTSMTVIGKVFKIFFILIITTTSTIMVNSVFAQEPTPTPTLPPGYPTPTPVILADYAVSASAGPGGTISPNGTGMFAYPGSSWMFTITPNPGYQILDVQDNGVSLGAISTYKFTIVQECHMVKATFSLISTPTLTPTPTASPTPTPSENTIQATTNNGSTIHLAINGNITSPQISNVAITTNQSESTTTLSFTLTDQNATAGFSNITIPKTSVTYGTTPKIYIDNQPASNQGFTQDNNNYYVWYTTHFSTHQISIKFTISSSPSPTASNSGSQVQSSLPEVVYGLVVAVAVVIIVVIVLQVVTKGRKAKARQSK